MAHRARGYEGVLRLRASLRILIAPRLLEAQMPTAALVLRGKHTFAWAASIGLFALACVVWPHLGQTVLNIFKIAVLYAANTRG